MVKRKLILAAFILHVICVSADIWGAPEVIITYSQNNEYMLQIYPREYPDWLYSKKARKQYEKQHGKLIVGDVIIPCHAVLAHIYSSDTVEIWNRSLVNFTLPFGAIVANDGKSVVTTDDWGMVGYDHTLVIYGEDGELIEDFALKDISPFPLEQYARTMSSIRWGSNVKYLDNDRIEILFRNGKGEERKRIFNIKTRVFEPIIR